MTNTLQYAELNEVAARRHRTPPVVVGVDGRQPSLHALEWALAEADRRHCPCDVVAVSADWRHAADVAWTDLDSVVDTVRSFNGLDHVPVQSLVMSGHPGPALRSAAADAAMLVVGTRGRSAVTEALFGSVAEDCLRQPVSCPIVVVPPATRIQSSFGRVVVGVDGSPSSRSALVWAAGWAGCRGADLVVVHAWHVLVPPVTPFAPAAWEASLEAATVILGRAIERASQITPDVHSRLLMSTATSALRAEAAKADLLVVGARGRGPWTGALVGSVSQSCARHAPCPVAIVRNGPA
jgi:nucleotide-binding universal stress UspA family protein